MLFTTPIKIMTFSLLAFTLTGCASSPDLTIAANYCNQPPKNIMIVMTKPSTTSLHIENNVGVIGSLINSDSMFHLNKMAGSVGVDTDLYKTLTGDAAVHLTAQHKQVTIYPHLVSNNDLKTLAALERPKNAVLFILNINSMGASGHYSEFTASSSPAAYISLTGELTDASTDTTSWRYTVSVAQPIKGVTNQVTQANFKTAFSQATKLAINELFKNMDCKKQG
jgi:hypothetical protein